MPQPTNRRSEVEGKEYTKYSSLFKQSGFEIELNKCQLHNFDKKGTANGMGNYSIRKKKGFFDQINYKIFGSTLTSNLDREDEINAIVRKCKNLMKTVNSVKHTWCGVDAVILYMVFIRLKIEYGAFLFHVLKKKQLQKLEKIQYRVICRALGYRSSSPTNTMLAEAKETPIFCKLKELGRNLLSMCYTLSNHPMIQLLEELSALYPR
jgi:hypothetical protein